VCFAVMCCDVVQWWRSRGKTFVDPLNLTAMACPALPLCGLAIAEAERGLPDILERIRAMLGKVHLGGRCQLTRQTSSCYSTLILTRSTHCRRALLSAWDASCRGCTCLKAPVACGLVCRGCASLQVGLKKQSDTLVVRMTGCPNGCARPYMAELGSSGMGRHYQVSLRPCPALGANSSQVSPRPCPSLGANSYQINPGPVPWGQLVPGQSPALSLPWGQLVPGQSPALYLPWVAPQTRRSWPSFFLTESLVHE